MRLGIGVDTGGTYTDAVLYDYDTAQVLCTAKSPTTHHNLEIGITNALDQLPEEYFPDIGLAALSTTLATNACVEGKGGRSRLLLLGVDADGTSRYGTASGLPPVEEIRFLDCTTTIRGEILREPDWELLDAHAEEWFTGDEAICIVEQHAMRNAGVLERKARSIIRSHNKTIPIICGSDLFSDLYVFQRAASALLNGGLLPVVAAFLRAIEQVFASRGLDIPRVTVRSDGTLMNETMTYQRPVDTLLSGPAASVCGGLALSGAETCVIADMGGTTTDVALATDGAPLRAQHGIRVGKWATFAKGLDIDTFALGGDTGIRVENEQPKLLHRRLMSLCVLAQQYPAIKDDLIRLEAEIPSHTLPLHECFVLQRDIADDDARYTENEHDLIAALRARPLIFSDAAEAAGVDKYMLRPERLEREGIVQRAGLTPTDIMHINGDFNRFDAEAPLPALNFLARCCKRTAKQLADHIYDMAKERLYTNLVRILMEHRQPALREEGLPQVLQTMIARSWRAFADGETATFLQPCFVCHAPLVGLGAPMHLFLPDVAKALGTICILPPHADVANAVGAVCGSVRVEITVEIRQSAKDLEHMGSFYLLDEPDMPSFERMEDAIDAARILAEQRARAEAKLRGAHGDISVTFSDRSTDVDVRGTSLHLSTYVTAVAVGAVGFRKE